MACARAPSELVLPDEKSGRSEEEDGDEASDPSSGEDPSSDEDEAAADGDDEMPLSGESSAGDESSEPDIRGPISGGRDAGAMAGDDDTGASAECGTDNYTADDACSMCLCAKCASQIATCYASSDSTKNQLCSAIQECAEQNRCASTECYCGASTLCLAPAGRCVDVIESAAGSVAVGTAADDPQNPVGRADAIGVCALANCVSECGLTAPRR